MNLAKKKQLIARALKVGKGRIILDEARLDELKEAITKQDIRDLHKSGAITIRERKGRRKQEKRKIRRGEGKIKKRVKERKRHYVRITRKLRNYAKELKKEKRIDNKNYRELRKKIAARIFASKSQLKEHLNELKKK